MMSNGNSTLAARSLADMNVELFIHELLEVPQPQSLSARG
jgi:hypothetical protein